MSIYIAALFRVNLGLFFNHTASGHIYFGEVGPFQAYKVYDKEKAAEAKER
jgi:hypothetical protein